MLGPLARRSAAAVCGRGVVVGRDHATRATAPGQLLISDPLTLEAKIQTIRDSLCRLPSHQLVVVTDFDRTITSCGSDETPADCDDDDPNSHPDSFEVDGDLRDNDCDGLVDEGDWTVGDLVITELMTNPDNVMDIDGEWVELHNASDRALMLNGRLE